MASADFSNYKLYNLRPPQVIACSFRLFLSHLHICPFGVLWALQRCACLPEQICLICAGLVIIKNYLPILPVRQYRLLPFGFLHCIPHGKPACHLLILPSVTSVYKGLSPSGNISCTLMFNYHEKFVFYEFIQSF